MADKKGEPSSWSGPSISRIAQMHSHEQNASNAPVTIRGFDVHGPLTPVPEAPGSSQGSRDANHGHARTSDSDYFNRDGVRRRSSVAERLNALVDVGGVNSLHNFARSWQRAAGFYEITPVQRSFVVDSDSESLLGDDDNQPSDEEQANRQGASLLRSALQQERNRRVSAAPSLAPDEAVEEEGALSPGTQRREPRRSSGRERGSRTLRERQSSILEIEPQLSSVFGGSYGATYGSLAARVNESSMHHAGRLYMQQQSSGASAPDKEREPLLVKQVEHESGKTINVVVGQSTLPQTIFNSVNVLIGVGMLALPLAIRYSGWLIGISFFVITAITTSYTAKLLAKCLDVDGSLITFADLAYVSFGPRARVAVSLLFTLELLATCVALVVLFADSLNTLIPGWGDNEFKILCGVIVIPLGFLPLRFLSFTSIIGILSCLGVIIAIFVDGFIKPESPGSLRNPAKTYLFPKDWRTLPLAFGLLMAPFGGHSVFPNIYRDMRHPQKYSRGVNYTYIFTSIIELSLGAAGYLMFGEGVLDILTSSIFSTEGYPRSISIIIVVAIAIIPLTKIPLNARPIISTIEIYAGLDSRALAPSPNMAGMSNLTRGILKLTIRIAMPILFVILAILVPSFDRIMGLLGSLACFTVCVILPCSFHLTIFGQDLSLRQRVLDWSLVVIGTLFAVAGTVAAFLPKRLLGAEV